MQLRNPGATIFVPDGRPVEQALPRVTHLGIGAHPDDLEFMALHGILAHFRNFNHWFGGIVLCHGGEEERETRRQEQIEAARIGQYAFVVMLDYPSERAQAWDDPDIPADLATLLDVMQPEIAYLHNPADKHPTHIGACRHALGALREMPDERKPKTAYGCEVWRGLDWLPNQDKVVLNVSDHPEMSEQLTRCFASQKAGGKRYDLAVPGRRHANATFLDPHKPDRIEQAIYAMDLSTLLRSERADLNEFTGDILKRFKKNVLDSLVMKPTLVILAAGIGSRYGGLKQIDPVGPNGELVIDYSIFDALRAGFGSFVFVIRRDIEKDFRNAIGHRIEARADVRYAFQERGEGRAKPWGTGHAVLVARDQVNVAFGVINADDFYGYHSYRLLAGHLVSGSMDFCMVGFKLRQTLSEHGSVARGLCTTDTSGYLQTITEVTHIEKLDGKFTGDEIVSMNFWGFTPNLFGHLAQKFETFAREKAGDPKAEMYLPSSVDQLIRDGQARVRVLQTPDAWFGVTYQQDRPQVVEGIRGLIKDGAYPGAPLDMTQDLKTVASCFTVPGLILSIEPHLVGHINDSYAVACKTDRGVRRFLLQRINHQVFQDPERLMENVQRVTEHLRAKSYYPERETLTLVKTAEGKTHERDRDGNWWRMYVFIEDTRTVDVAENPEQARAMARAFGLFQQRLADLPAPRLHETIPGFHNTVERLAALEQVVSQDRCQRVDGVEEEIAFALARRDLAGVLMALESRGSLPERVVHNDTKINNVLLDADTGLPLCVADLDTVMPGLAVHDFGDLVRTATSPAAEDEPDLEKVSLRMPMFEALARGYLETAGAFLSAVEINQLVTASQVMTFEVGVRFLTDYLNGDVYFKAQREHHNLDRCRTQFRLLECMEQAEAEMCRVIRGML